MEQEGVGGEMGKCIVLSLGSCPFFFFFFLLQRTSANAVELQSSVTGNLTLACGILRNRMRHWQTGFLKGLGHMRR